MPRSSRIDVTDDVSSGIGTIKIISMVEGVRIGVTSLHGTLVYLLIQSRARVLSDVHKRIYGLIIAPVQLKKEA